MNKKILIPAFILLIAALVILMKFSIKEPVQGKNSLTASVTVTPTIKIPSNTLKEHSDPSGFTFSFPEDVEIKNNQKNDNSIYSNLVLTSNVATGSVDILVSDTKYKSADAWKKDNKALTSGLEIKDAKLGDLTGISFIDGKKLTQLVFDQGIQFKIEVDFQNENKYWENVYNSITSSFSFASSSNTSTGVSSDSSDSDVIYDGEEVIE